ncbi:MAG: response regulator [Spirochaetales bacterium]|nr:response regulator [Spirochaetales bacterium]
MDNEIVNIFLQEAKEHLTKSNNAVMVLERDGVQADQIKILKSEIHTLKGDSRMLGFSDISEACHRIEDYILLFEGADLESLPQIVKAVFSILDLIQNAVAQLPGKKLAIDLGPFKPSEVSSSNKGDSDDEMSGKADSAQKKIAKVNDDKKASSPKSAGSEGASEQKAASKAEYLNINVNKLESLVKVSSAFPRYSSRFNYILNKLRAIEIELGRINPEDPNAKALGEAANDFSHELAFYDLAARQFQDEITKLKLVPLSTIFDIFPRLVRDVAENTGKTVNFVVKGSEVELDKTMVENLKNVLIHLLRNAVDHGIEKPEDREASGKGEIGRIRLLAIHQGENVIVEVSDDGYGLNIDRIRTKALEKGVITDAQAAKMTENEIIALIFESGFSTKEVGDFSGRGVGMDVVAETVKQMNGEIKVQSFLGKGTTFNITLPLVSSYLPVTIFSLKNRLYGIPSSYVESVLFVKKSQIIQTDMNKDQQITYKNLDISLIDLADTFGLGQQISDSFLVILICRYMDEVTGLIIEDVVMEKKLIISRTRALKNQLRVIIGGVLLGLERVIPVVNVATLFEIFKEGKVSLTKMLHDEEVSHNIGFKNILLVEDSKVTRTSEKKILTKQNFNVFEAGNGKEALEILEKENIDCVISDIEMPVMNGLEMIQQIRGNSDYDELPIIVVSSYKNYNDVLKELKVAGVIDKGNFTHDVLMKSLAKVNLY